MLSTKPIDASQLTFRYSGTAQHFEYDRDTEKRDKDQTRHPDTGFPMWKVRCVAVYRAAGEHGEITVTVAAKEPPTARLRRGDHVLRPRRQGLGHQREPRPDLAGRNVYVPCGGSPGIGLAGSRIGPDQAAGGSQVLTATAAPRQATASEPPP